jgi:hemerythrin-like domain-containing protein
MGIVRHELLHGQLDAVAAATRAGTLRVDDELPLTPLAADEEGPAVTKLRSRLDQRRRAFLLDVRPACVAQWKVGTMAQSGVGANICERLSPPSSRVRRLICLNPGGAQWEESLSMEHCALTVIRAEHRVLVSVLHAIVDCADERKQRGGPLDFGLLRAMLLYVDEFPEQLHHREESQLLFPPLRLRSSEARAVLDQLELEHRQGHEALLELEHALLAYEFMGATRREAFEAALHRYVDTYLNHIHIEETAILPLAERVLSEHDWAVLDTVFMLNHDPLTGHPPADEYAPLIRRIAAEVAGLAS